MATLNQHIKADFNMKQKATWENKSDVLQQTREVK
jgi:hypothetical protein